MFLNSLKTVIIKAVSFKNPSTLPLSYWMLVFIRIALTLAPQVGYLHPDEFFQNVEVVAADVLEVDHARIWEFDPEFPLRNMFVPIMVFGPPLYLIRIVDPYTKHYLGISLRTPYYLLVIPRLVVCLLSFINDYCMYKMCVLHGEQFRNRLVILASSHVMLVYACRSFSNTFEMIFFSVLLLLVSKWVLRSDNMEEKKELAINNTVSPEKQVEKVKLPFPEHPLNNLALATLIVIGIFNRPTFVGFAFPSVLFWLLYDSKSIGFKEFQRRAFTFGLYGVPAVFFNILVDSVYYGSSSEETRNYWVMTPLNFVKYNMLEENLARHGLHPRWCHVVRNMPLLFGHLAGAAFFMLCTNTYKFFRGYSQLPKFRSVTGLMLLSLIVPLAMLSLFPHQEARFIMPLFVPLVYLCGDTLHPNSDGTKRKLKNILLCTWFILNATLTVFYGFVHQGGMYRFTETLYREIKSTEDVDTYIMTTYSYSITTYLLQLESFSKVRLDEQTGKYYTLRRTTFFYERGSVPMDELFSEVHDLLTKAETRLHEHKQQYRFYVATACALDSEVEDEARKYFYFKLVDDFRFYPHYSSEAKPKFPSRRDQFCIETDRVKADDQSYAVDLNMYQRIFCYFKKFCLKVYRVIPKNS